MTNTIEKQNSLAKTLENHLDVPYNGVELVQSRIVSETADYTVVQTPDGKFSRKAKYRTYSSIKATTREEKMWLMNMLDGDSEFGQGLKDSVGEKIEIADIITRPYDSINEETGELDYGVLCYLITPEKQVYVTSAKAVYFYLQTTFEMFGRPDEPEWENIFVTVIKEKREKGDAIKIKMIG